MNQTNLSLMRVGDRARISGVSGNGLIQQRMLEMGVSPGADIEVLRRAPLGDPIEVHVRGFNLMLRKREAELIGVECAPR